MARRWTTTEEHLYRSELQQLYVEQNKTIGAIARQLKISKSGVYDRLVRLNISTDRSAKPRYNNRRLDVVLPELSTDMAELFGILLGDGHISHFQVTVTLGTKEAAYAMHVQRLLRRLFGGTPKVLNSRKNHRVVYLGSTLVTRWLKEKGLVQNKVTSQVDAPAWIFAQPAYVSAFLRGFFDTDGSIYKLRFGTQLSFTNHSAPLLHSLQAMLRALGYKPSAISAHRIYLTKVPDIKRFFLEIRPANPKHLRRYRYFMRR